MFNSRKRRNTENLIESFGKIKDDSFDFEQIETYFRNKDNSNSLQVLSDKTCNDLDFEELFMFIDRTQSKVGQQYLYNKLRTIPADANDFDTQEKTVTHFTNDLDFRISVQKQLLKLNEREAYYVSSLFQEEHLQPPSWFFIVRLLSFSSLLCLIVSFFNPTLFLVLLGIIVVNLGVHYWNKKNLYRYVGSIPQLLKLNAVARELYKAPLLKEINPHLQQSIAVIDKVRNRMSFFNLETKLQSDIQLIFWGILELIKIIFLLEPLLLFDTLKQLDTKRKEIEDIFTFAGQIDSFISIASLRKGLDNYCIPQITTERQTLISTGAYHPLICNCVKKQYPVRQEIHIAHRFKHVGQNFVYPYYRD